MTDYFELLNEPRRPWGDPEALKTKFLALSAQFHPDRFPHCNGAEKEAANQKFAEINTAYQCLRDPKERLQHLLQLELSTPPKEVQRIPPGTTDLFAEVGQMCREAETFLTQKALVTAPLIKVQYFEKGMEWTDRLQALQQKISAGRGHLLEELKSMNDQWDALPTGAGDRAQRLPLERLEQVYRTLSYIGRWTEQIQERILQLSL